tara:strand:+ start:920 stop:1093 length:174 start_codon:yes stop_codon:yes gene_type:complete
MDMTLIAIGVFIFTAGMVSCDYLYQDPRRPFGLPEAILQVIMISALVLSLSIQRFTD